MSADWNERTSDERDHRFPIDRGQFAARRARAHGALPPPIPLAQCVGEPTATPLKDTASQGPDNIPRGFLLHQDGYYPLQITGPWPEAQEKIWSFHLVRQLVL